MIRNFPCHFPTAAVFSLFVLYAGAAVCELAALPVYWSPAAVIAFFLIQYILFPPVLDRAFRGEALPEETPVLRRLSESFRFKKSVLWETAYPVLYIYGHSGKTLRLIVSRGFLERFGEDRQQCIAAWETERIRAGHFVFFMASGLLPYAFYRAAKAILLLSSCYQGLGSSNSIASFGQGLKYIADINYRILYLASRAATEKLDGEFFSRGDGGKMARILEETAALKVQENDENALHQILALDFLHFSDTGRYFRYSAATEINETRGSQWENYLDLSYAQPSLSKRTDTLQGTGKKTAAKKTADFWWAVSVPALASLCIFLPLVHLNPAIPLILLGLCILMNGSRTRPWKKLETPSLRQLTEETPLSPGKGHPIALSGKLRRALPVGSFRDTAVLEAGEYRFPIVFATFNRPVISEDGQEAELAGWLRKSDLTYIEAAAIQDKNGMLYNANPTLLLRLAGIFAILFGMFMLTFMLNGFR